MGDTPSDESIEKAIEAEDGCESVAAGNPVYFDGIGWETYSAATCNAVQGWQCPFCGVVYAPHIASCYCVVPVQYKTPKTVE